MHKYLSDREYQVLCLIAAGKEVTAISTESMLRAKAISTYRGRRLEKMNLKTSIDLRSPGAPAEGNLKSVTASLLIRESQ